MESLDGLLALAIADNEGDVGLGGTLAHHFDVDGLPAKDSKYLQCSAVSPPARR